MFPQILMPKLLFMANSTKYDRIGKCSSMHYAQRTNNDHVICNFFYFDSNYWVAAINELVNGTDFSDFYESTFNHTARIKVYSGKS